MRESKEGIDLTLSYTPVLSLFSDFDFFIVLSLLHFHFLYSATLGLPRRAPDDLPITQIDLFSSF